MAQLAAAGSWFSGLEAAVFRPVSLRCPYQHQDGVDGAEAMRPADLVLIRMYESKTPFNLGCDGSLLLSVPGPEALWRPPGNRLYLFCSVEAQRGAAIRPAQRIRFNVLCLLLFGRFNTFNGKH